MKPSRLVLLAGWIVGIALLCGLGYWQVQRLQWKQDLIAAIEARTAEPPRPLSEIEVLWSRTGDVEYYPVRLAGEFQHALEQYFHATHQGAVGWHVYTPLVLDNGRTILVNRGFVPDAMRDPEQRPGSQPSGRVEVMGLARNPLYEKPNRFVPDNEPQKSLYFWRDLGAMASAAGIEPDALVPFQIDALPSGDGYPIGGTTILRLPNDHLQYALTWFGLAAALAAVGGYYFISAQREHRS